MPAFLDYMIYREGTKAYEEGQKLDDCPYESGEKLKLCNGLRISWMTGWLDSHSCDILGDVFKKYKVRFP